MQLFNVDQQNALFKIMFNSIIIIFYVFRTSYVPHQEDLIAHVVLYGMFLMHLCKQSNWLQDVLEHILQPSRISRIKTLI
jgi:hypothetical protein